jgi:hypothetical protein
MSEIKKYNVLYDGRIIHREQTFEDAADIIQEYADQFFEGDESINPNLIELEEI